MAKPREGRSALEWLQAAVEGPPFKHGFLASSTPFPNDEAQQLIQAASNKRERKAALRERNLGRTNRGILIGRELLNPNIAPPCLNMLDPSRSPLWADYVMARSIYYRIKRQVRAWDRQRLIGL